MFFQPRTPLQENYYKTWLKTGKSGDISSALTGKSSGDHYVDHYANLVDIHNKLHPYQFINKDYFVVACGCHNGKVEVGTSQPIIFSSLAKHVLVLEPDPVNIKALEDYMSKHDIDNITILPKAIWHEETEVDFTIFSEEHTAANQIGVLGGGRKVVKIPTITFDKILADYGQIDFVNLTINGAEKAALVGAPEMLKTNTEVCVVTINKNQHMFKGRMEALKMLEDSGYSIGWGNGPTRPWMIKNFHFAVGTKDTAKLLGLGFEEKPENYELWAK